MNVKPRKPPLGVESQGLTLYIQLSSRKHGGQDHGSTQAGNEAAPSEENAQETGETDATTSGGLQPEMTDCLFCKIAAGEIPSQTLLNTDRFYAFRDINPQAPDHVLLIPKKHIERLADLSAEDSTLVGEFMVTAAELARKLGMHEAGFRFVINNGERAGQSVWHLHAHLLSGRDFAWPPG